MTTTAPTSTAKFIFTYGEPVTTEEARDLLTRHPAAVINGLPFQEYGDFSTDPVTDSLVIATTDWQAVAAAIPTYLQTILSEHLTAEATADSVRWVQVRPTRLANIDSFRGTSYRTEHDDGRPITGDDDGAIQVVCVELVRATATDVASGAIAAAATR